MLSRLCGINWHLGQSLRLLGSTPPKKLPAAFLDCQAVNGLYIDKTPHLATLFTNRRRVLFTLPRLFGKSTTLNLVQQLCEDKSVFTETELGKTDFFKTWPNTVPCLKFEFQSVMRVRENIMGSIIGQANAAQVTLNKEVQSVNGYLTTLLEGLYAKKKQDVVVLVDEYDDPLNISDETARNTNAAILFDFFGALKAFRHLKLLMVVGTMDKRCFFPAVTNDIEDVSRHRAYANIFGFTKEELENKIFPPDDAAFYNALDFKQNQETISEAENLQKQQLLAQSEKITSTKKTTENAASSSGKTGEEGPVETVIPLTIPEKRELFLKQIQQFYNGYLFSTEGTYSPVYNPYSVLKCKNNNGNILHYWADMSYLHEMSPFVGRFPHLMDKDVVITIHSSVSASCINDLVLTSEDHRSLERLWAYGFLSIYKLEDDIYTLVPTNGEVVSAYREQVLNSLMKTICAPELESFVKSATEGDCKGLSKSIEAVLLSEENRIYAEADITSTLSYFCWLTEGRVRSIREVTDSNKKRMDVLIKAYNQVYVIELKFNGTSRKAFKQIRDKKYCGEILNKFKDCQVYAVGLNYSEGTGVSAIACQVHLLPNGEADFDIDQYHYGLV